MSTSTKSTRERIWSATRYCENVQTAKPSMARAADENFGEGAGEEVTRLVDRIEAAVRRELDALIKAETDHLAELADDPTVRGVRELANDDCRDAATRARSAFVLAYGEEVATRIGLEPVIPEHPEEVHRMAVTACVRWEKEKEQGELPTVKGVDVEPFMEALSVCAAALGDALKQVAREEAEARATIEGRRRATASFDKVYSASGRIGAALLELAGELRMARDLTPSRSRPGRSVAVAEGREEVPEELDVVPPAPAAPAPAPGAENAG